MDIAIKLLDSSGSDPFPFLRDIWSTYSAKTSKTVFLSFGGSMSADPELEIAETLGCSIIIVPDTRDKLLGWLEVADCLASREPHPNPKSEFSIGSDDRWVLPKKLRIITDSIPWWSKGTLALSDSYSLETVPFYDWMEAQCKAIGLLPEETRIDIVKIDVCQKLERSLLFSMLDAGFRPSSILVKWSSSPNADFPTKMTAGHLHNAGYVLVAKTENNFFYWFADMDIYSTCSLENTKVANPMVHAIAAEVASTLEKNEPPVDDQLPA